MKSDEKGLLSLEACVSVTIFMFLMLFLYSFFTIFEARNEIGHVVLSASNSMAVDAFENTKLGNGGNMGQIIYNLYGVVTNSDNGFTDYRQWYDDWTQEDDDGNKSLSDTFSEVVKERFIAYLTSGNSADANKILKKYKVKDGIDGLDFSGSYIDSSKGNLYLKVKYTLEYDYNPFGFNGLEFEQSACSKLWK